MTASISVRPYSIETLQLIRTHFRKKASFALWKYGTDYWSAPLRTFLVGNLPVTFISAIAYMSSGLQYEGEITHNFWDALYLSGVTITTLGYGDATPVGFGKVVAVVESMFGILLFSFVLVLFTRKYID
ncbi:potassium channel family protein [Alicyclobacillus tolerans]|uniref:potassium channel family protein n=1 Tax=Alicyclobacillus tolerans TaxID=90970 RepID=UPI003B7B7675